ncbi:23S rRNA (adenine2030-N6)-methyltransferase [Roseibium hamelinense]|uniref:Ribosomal RNA large subunit methyltransferase J n=1 Tax=Roseibium hamelinense TaxID=150831 RepID=A0A562SZB5_9HYPH|nr:23S rRNA (adenine(2030)-N(6))-methyltransferase RlmJ [Roseibium hamelinense]MTI43658.1 23S rRNA (adenine(2030)-N(6))-methyltransferase RlmJ [Roseibium hamelinense]TWI86176.1 23S rRNA (adenine2030-N6)-methyltransferase [Roseibium hamelinense]
MNYRHAFHAGNLGDVLKHAVLARIIVYLQKKDKPFRVIDTHAGIGLYDLTSDETQRTGEWQRGIGKVYGAEMPEAVRTLLAPWLDVVAAHNTGTHTLERYPGSPVLTRSLLRKGDRLTLTELHPADFQTLSALFAGDYQVKTIHLDGWLALNGFLPPKEKRGLVIVDPAYEATDEFDRMSEAVIKGWKKWPGGIYALWYPLKDRTAIERMFEALEGAGIRNVLRLELATGISTKTSSMLGSGMAIINPPFTLQGDMKQILPWLKTALGGAEGSGWTLEQQIAE